jgi:hypothetical protein
MGLAILGVELDNHFKMSWRLIKQLIVIIGWNFHLAAQGLQAAYKQRLNLGYNKMITHNLSIEAGFSVRVSINPTDASTPPQPTTLDSNPTAVSSNTGIATVVPYDNELPMQGWWIKGIAVGTAIITITAFSNGKDKSEQIVVTVSKVEAASLGLSFSTPTKR